MDRAAVDVNILSTNELPVLKRSLANVLAQTYPAVRATVIDNASTDGTSEWLRRTYPDVRVIRNEKNLYYCASHNRAYREGTGEYVLPLNADVFLAPDFIAKLVEALEIDPQAGQAQGKLYQARSVDDPGEAPEFIDTVGILVTRARRNFDRGQEEPEIGQYDFSEEIFGADGSAPLYRRAMLEEIAPDDNVFDPDFLIYREVVDLSWRAQAAGWRALYVPAATGFHVRGFSPRTRTQMKPLFRRLSYRNRWATLIRNMTLRELLPHLGFLLSFELLMLGHVLLRERQLLRCWPEMAVRLPRWRRDRRAILLRRRTTARQLRGFFV